MSFNEFSLPEPANDIYPDNVTSLDHYRIDPHFQGEAFCLACGHTWQQVAPAGTYDLPCSSCGAERGVLRYPIDAVAGSSVYRCDCGSEVHMLVVEPKISEPYLHCIGCGCRHSLAVIFSHERG